MSARPRLVLASASPSRRRLLEDAGFAPLVVVSDVDEDGVEADHPAELVAVLAARKAEAVARRFGGEPVVVVGCDSALDVDGEAHGKPGSATEALARARALRGRAAVLRTGHCVIDCRTGRRAAAVASTVVRFGEPTDSELVAYVATGEPLQVAGGFTIEGRGAPFIDGVDGDPGNVIGLSLPLLRRLLSELGIGITDLWT